MAAIARSAASSAAGRSEVSVGTEIRVYSVTSRIQARPCEHIDMLATGIKSPVGVKVLGSDLAVLLSMFVIPAAYQLLRWPRCSARDPAPT